LGIEADAADKIDLPSLAWAQNLGDDALRNVLDGFTARDLASAWIGPARTLARFERLMGDRKASLVRRYLSRERAERGSAAFRALHGAIVNALGQGRAA